MESAVGKTNTKFGWTWLVIGILGAMMLGLLAFKSDWMGGYTSLERRFLRLHHISFMALSLTNILYGLCIDSGSLSIQAKKIGSYSMIIAAVFMPAICFLCVFNSFFQNFFFIPAGAFALAIFLMAFGQFKKG